MGAFNQTVSGNANQGAVYIFTGSGSTWTQAAELTAGDGAAGDRFGETVALFGTTLAATADDFNGGAWQVGAGYLFRGSGSTWNQTAEFAPSDGENGDQFGFSLALTGTTMLVGAPQNSYLDEGDGAAYVFPSDGTQTVGTLLGADTWGGGSKSQGCQPCVDGSGGDPVNTATGDLSESATDVTLPGAGVPLSFIRTYDAQSAQAEVMAGEAAGPLGYGWSDNFAMNVSYNSSTQTATVSEENGAQTTFSPYVSGTSPAWCSGSTNFCATAPRTQATLNQNSGGSWTYTRLLGNPETFSFDSSGALTQLTDAAGDSLASSAYSPTGGQTSCPSGDTCTAWTSSASGRELVLAVNSAGQLVEVFDANSTLETTFAYSGSGCSSWSGSETADLCSVVDPDAITSAYTYDSGNANADFVYDMLTETPPGASASPPTSTTHRARLPSRATPPVASPPSITSAPIRLSTAARPP